MLKQILIPGKKNLIALYAVKILSWIIISIVSHISQQEYLVNVVAYGLNIGGEIFRLSSSLTNIHSAQNPEIRDQYRALTTMILTHWKVATVVILSLVLMIVVAPVSQTIALTTCCFILALWTSWYIILTIRGLITSCRLSTTDFDLLQ